VRTRLAIRGKGGGVQLPLVGKLRSECKFSRVAAIVVVDALQLIEAVGPVPTLKPVYGGFKMVNVSE